MRAMANVGGQAAKRAAQILTESGRLATEVAEIATREGIDLPLIGADEVWTHNIGSDLAEKSAGARYPRIYIYCEGLTNQQREKFRCFSGKIYLTAEIRVSHDRVERVTEQLMSYVEAVTNLLEQNRGGWASGLYYAGGYRVEFGPIRPGGRNFLQAAKVKFELDASLG